MTENFQAECYVRAPGDNRSLFDGVVTEDSRGGIIVRAIPEERRRSQNAGCGGIGG